MSSARVPACIDYHEIQHDEPEKIQEIYQIDHNLLRTGPAHNDRKDTIEKRQQKHFIITVMNIIDKNVNRYEECRCSEYTIYYFIDKPPSFSHGHCNKLLLTLYSKRSEVITSMLRPIDHIHPPVRNR